MLVNIYFIIYTNVYFVDFMYDKDDNIEIMSTKSHTNSSRPESRNLEDRFVIIYFKNSIYPLLILVY